MNYEGFNLMRSSLAKIVDKQLSIVQESSYDDVVRTNEKPSHQLREAKKRLQEGNLRVLVMGKFSGGKSAFLNGMLGRPLLPMGALPKTAVIGEIRYAEKETIVLLPKPGKWKNGDNPFEITAAELDKYTSIDHTAGGAKENPFQKVYINSPLSICKNGIEFVDSPGLDDPTSHDNVTKEYLPTADAIIYCMNSGAAYSAKDKDEIDTLRSLGYKSIIFVMTYFDQLLQNDERMGTHDAQITKEYLIRILSPLTELGADGIFFVNSVAAIQGKVQNDEALLKSSNFPYVEKRLEEILVNQRGRIKLIHSLYMTKNINRRNGKYISETSSLAKNDHNSIANELTNAQQNLNLARTKADLINQQVASGISDIANNCRIKGGLFYLDSILPSVEGWINEAEPECAINVIHLNDSVKKYTQELIEHLKTKMCSSVSSWSENDLVKNCIEHQMNNLLLYQSDNIRAYLEQLKTVKVNLNIPIDSDDIGEQTTPCTANRILSAGAGLLIGDICSAILGGALVLRAMLTTLAAEISAGIVLGIVSLLTPVGIPALIIGAVLAALGSFGVNVMSIKSQIKKKVIVEAKKSLSNNKEKFQSEIYSAVNGALGEVKDKISDELIAPINEAQALVESAQENMNSTGLTLERKLQKFTKLKEDNDSLTANLDAFSEKLNLN